MMRRKQSIRLDNDIKRKCKWEIDHLKHSIRQSQNLTQQGKQRIPNLLCLYLEAHTLDKLNINYREGLHSSFPKNIYVHP